VPVYQYACTECGEQLEARQSFTDEPLSVCPACGGRLRKVLSAVGVVFKGSGFYRTDSRKESASAGASADGASTSKDASGAGASGRGTGSEAAATSSGKGSSGSGSGSSGSGSGASGSGSGSSGSASGSRSGSATSGTKQTAS
jgi:putative FmdB family regulatory protein